METTNPAPDALTTATPAMPPSLQELRARATLLCSEMDANDEENSMMQAEVNELYRKIDAATAWRDRKWAKYVPGPLMDTTLDNIANDDKRPPTLAEAIEQATYVLGLYAEGGTVANEELNGEHGKDAQRGARAEIRKCNAFIAKFAELAKGMISIRISDMIRNEWQTRGITDIVPMLANLAWETSDVIKVDLKAAAEIRADCEFYIDPKAVDATLGERAAYRALLRQIDAASDSA